MRLIKLLFIGIWEGLSEAYSRWRTERYKERKWREARCATCHKGFSRDESIYETGKGYMHRDCHYAPLFMVNPGLKNKSAVK